jgi:S1-C subfamily serine protease
LAAVLVAAACAGAGCTILGIGIREEHRSPIDPSAPVFLRAPARELAGHALEDVVVLAERTEAMVPIDSGTIRRVAEGAMPAVVSIYTETPSPYRVNLLPLPLPGTSFRLPLRGEALGSAFFTHPSGYLVSNNHVIDNARSIKAKTADGADFSLIVVARDPALDLALLRVREPRTRFPYIPIGDSDAVGAGDLVIAIGNSLGLDHSVTEGIISQTGRRVAQLERGHGRRHIAFLQTSTAINQGSSGGPLITLSGAAIGVNAAAIVGAQGVAFTVPSSQVLEFVRAVLAGDGVEE